MKRVELGKSGVSVSSVTMGLWQAGKTSWVDVDDKEIERAIDAAIEHGITSFDTAEEYGGGHSERTLGAVIKGRRDKVEILTKVFSNHLKREQVIAACERSLKHLATDVIDLYQVHWPAGSWGSDVVPIAETLDAMSQLKRDGKIRAIGVSNFSLEQLREAQAVTPIDSLQSPYSLYWRHLDQGHTEHLAKTSAALLAYSPLSHGLLTGRFAPGHRFAKGDNRRSCRLTEPSSFERVHTANQSLADIATARGCSLAQLALAWIVTRGHVAIAGARTAAQISDSAKAGELELAEDLLVRMDEVAAPVWQPFRDEPVPWNWSP